MKAPYFMGTKKMTFENQKNKGLKDDEKKEVSVAKQNSRKMCVFGTCLDNLMENSHDLAVPFVVSRLCCYIENRGLLQRGLYQETEEIVDVDSFKKEFDESGDASLELKGNVTVAMKLLKQFLEELPEPLIPVSMHAAFLDAKQCALVSDDCINHLKSLVDLLPHSAFCVLKYLSHFLLQIAKHGRSNESNPTSLSVMFGPIIFRPNKPNILRSNMMKNITHCFVADYDAIFANNQDVLPVNRNQNIVPPDLQHSGKRRQVAPFPSSVGPLLSMQPLKVVIPVVDSAVKSRNKLGLNLNHPNLLIENHTIKLNDDGPQHVNTENDMVKTEFRLALPGTRKRKETLLMTDDLLPHKLVEQLSFPFSVEINELSSDTEHTDTYHLSNYLEISGVNESSQSYEAFSEKPVNSFMNDITHDDNHSPHPPDPKRRELEFLDCRQNILDEKYRTHHRNFVKYYNDPKQCSGLKRSSRAKKGSHEKNKVSLELTSWRDKHLSQSSSKEEINSDCLIPLKSAVGGGITPDNCVSEITRPASCPVPDKEDNYDLESDQPTLSLSWSKLFDSEEPVLSDRHINWAARRTSDEEIEILSPAVHHFRRFNSDLDSTVAPSPPTEQEHYKKIPANEDAFSLSIKQLTKKIHGLKKKIKRFDEKYEDEYGYKPSHAEKMNYPEARKLLNDLHKVRKDLKDLKEDSHLMSVTPTSGSWQPRYNVHVLEDTTNCLKDSSRLLKELAKKSKPSVQKLWGQTIKTLDDERKLANRPELIEEMTNDQVKDEKLAIQRVLLHFESIHGKPSKKTDRNTIRPLYDRYRNIKRILVKSSSFPVTNCKIPCIFNNLQPIMEHETMDFIAPTDEQTLDEHTEENINDDPSDALKHDEIKDSTDIFSVCFQFLDNKYNNSNLHELPLPEMIYQQHQARTEKRRMRKILREFEAEFMRINGRKVQKEDKAPVETLYEEYRLVKARLRLLEALISKHHHEHPNG